MIETTPRGSFNHDQTGNTFKMADGCGEEASRQKAPNWVYYEANYGPMKKYNVSYQRWEENIAAKLNNNGYKRTASQCKTKIHNLEQKYRKAKNLD